MAEKYVSHDGDDQLGDGSFGSPYRTIQKGIDSLSAGDTLWVKADSIYEMENLESGTGTWNSTNKTLTDASATFQTNGVTAGDNVFYGGNAYKIASVDSETQVTCTAAPGGDPSDSYTVGDQEAAQIDVDGADDKTIKGYYQTTGDQDFGGAYYKDSSHGWVVIDANNGSYTVLKVTLQNRNLENLKLINVNSASASYNGVEVISNYGGVMCRNLWLTSGASGIYGINRGLLIIDCKFTGSYYKKPGSPSREGPIYIGDTSYGTAVINCLFDVTGDFYQCLSDTSNGGTLIVGCIFNIKGTVLRAIYIFYATRVINNVIYNSGVLTYGILLGAYLRFATILNNIIQGATTPIYNDSDTNTYQDYNCYPGNTESHGVSSDPQFVDAANGDFRVRNPAVLRGGKVDINGNPTQMGPIKQKYQFSKRARAANLGRLAILR